MFTAAILITLGLLMIFFPQFLSFVVAMCLIFCGASIAYFKYKDTLPYRHSSTITTGIKTYKRARLVKISRSYRNLYSRIS